MENRRSHSLTGPLLSGNANNGTNAGSRNANTNNRATNANANYGFRLYREKDLRLCDPASWQKKLTGDGERFPSRNGTLFDRFVSHYTLVEAAMKAQVGKRKSKQIQDFNKKFGENIQRLHDQLASEMGIPCQYRSMKVFEPKERNIMIAPFYPHRIIHQAIVMVMKDSWIGNLIDNTYACIKGRGIHACMFDVRDALSQDQAGTRYCLKMDVSKYFDSIDHEVLKQLIRQELDDARLLHVIDNQIDSVPGGVGVPIGNLTSQYFANIYLTPLDHFCHEVLGLKYYFRYMDDVVMLHSDKAFLHHCRVAIENYLNDCLHLKLKRNWQVFPVASRQIDFVGYRLNHKGVMLRKKILTNFYKGVSKLAKSQRQIELKHQLSSHYGWVKYVDKIHQQNIYKNAEIKQKVILN
ncbi:RNA-directed DNA polymerase [Gaoshiqia sediminis]|uniref:RNA-directed DNA polymerase n=1 Tax=Gaoshiqia sediminis TaxID=2986998 RepID=A0AA41Y619_9BACT|nr:RNA-directed DNA polymerase [Gaoshiqia sediminis]MCW0484079.1 RNA-directed DNA polymerase [Gaoshiqia sediminis]